MDNLVSKTTRLIQSSTLLPRNKKNQLLLLLPSFSTQQLESLVEVLSKDRDLAKDVFKQVAANAKNLDTITSGIKSINAVKSDIYKKTETLDKSIESNTLDNFFHKVDE